MDSFVIVALLAAALLHASWHAMIKASGDRLQGLAGMNIVSAGVSLLALPWVGGVAHDLWPILIVSVLLHNGYKASLAQVYARAELGQAYPVARGLTPVFAMMIAWLVLGEFPRVIQLSGIGLISAGLFAIGLEPRHARLGLDLWAYAALTGLLAASYSVVDAFAARGNGDWLSYTVWLMVLDGGCFVGVMTAFRGRRLWADIWRERIRTLVSGLLGVAAFAVFLWALSRAPVGGVSALRETSVLFATLIGVVVLRERWSLQRIGGSMLIMAGIAAFAWQP